MDENQAKIKAELIDLDLTERLEKIDHSFESRGLAGGGPHHRAKALATIRAQHEKELLFAQVQTSQGSNNVPTLTPTVSHKWIPNLSEHIGILKILSNSEEIIFRSSYFGGINEFFKNPNLTTSRQSLKTGIAKHLQGGRKNPGQVSITQWKSDLKDGHPNFFKYFDIVPVSPDMYKLLPK
jgi:hypothetical protein